MCGHSLEVNVSGSLDFYLSVAQVQLLQQLLLDHMVGLDVPEKSAEVHTRTGTHTNKNSVCAMHGCAMRVSGCVFT